MPFSAYEQYFLMSISAIMGVRGGTSGTSADVPLCRTYTPVGLKLVVTLRHLFFSVLVISGMFPLWYNVIYTSFVSLGFVTNILCFLVMQTASLKGLTISVYLSFLAVVDFLVQVSLIWI